MFETGADPAEIVERKGLKQISDASALEQVAEQIIAANPDQVATLRTKVARLDAMIDEAEARRAHLEGHLADLREGGSTAHDPGAGRP
jgi:hypothetical protein